MCDDHRRLFKDHSQHHVEAGFLSSFFFFFFLNIVCQSKLLVFSISIPILYLEKAVIDVSCTSCPFGENSTRKNMGVQFFPSSSYFPSIFNQIEEILVKPLILNDAH